MSDENEPILPGGELEREEKLPVVAATPAGNSLAPW